MSEHIFHHRFHFFQTGESFFHLLIKVSAERIGGKIFEVLYSIGIAEIATEEHPVMVLYFL